METAGKGQIMPVGTRKNMRVFSEYRRKEQYHGGKRAKVKGHTNVTDRLKSRSNGTYSDFTKKWLTLYW